MAAKKKTRVYKCKFCDYRCNQKEEEYEHKRKHLNSDKTFACNACPFVTSFKHGLDYHEKSKHLKIKPYHCDKCKYDCVTKSMLKSHLKSHSPECEFVCTKCPYKTHHKHSLNQHVKQRHVSNEFDHIYSEVLSKQGNDSNNSDAANNLASNSSLSRSSSRRSSTSSGATTDTAIDPGSPTQFAPPPMPTGRPSPKALPAPRQSEPSPFVTPVRQDPPLAPAMQLLPQIDHQELYMAPAQQTVQQRPVMSPFQPLSLIPISAPSLVSPVHISSQQALVPQVVYKPMAPVDHLAPVPKPEPTEILDLRIGSKLHS